jgi:uncharacterized protein (TIGR00730 family)
MRRVCVFAGSSVGARPSYRLEAETLGRVLAARDIAVVYGGGRIGLMGVLADAVLEAGGHITGVIPGALATREIAHSGLSDLRVVTSMHERKAMMAELSDGFIAAPGGLGTLEEFFEILTWAQLGLHHKPCGLLNVDGYFDRLLALVEHATEEGFLRREHASMILVSASAPDLIGQMAAYQPPAAPKWIDKSEV